MRKSALTGAFFMRKKGAAAAKRISGPNGWDIGKLPMLMISRLSKIVNGSFCRFRAAGVEARRLVRFLSLCTKSQF